jgi:DNA-binding CsgD family transcriptional regulator
MSELNRFSRLIGKIYDAANDDGDWNDLVVTIAFAFGSESCAIQTRSGDRTELLRMTQNFTPDLLQQYQKHYYRTDEWANAAMLRPLNSVYFTRELVSERRLVRSEFYEYLKELGVVDGLGVVFPIGKHEIGVASVHCGRTPFGEDQRQIMELLLPHIRRALEFRSVILHESLKHSLAARAFDRLPLAAILVDSVGKVHYANHAAESLLRKGDGLTVRNGRLSADAPSSTQKLLDLVKRACADNVELSGPPLPLALALPRLRHSSLTLLSIPMRADFREILPQEPVAMLLVRDAERDIGGAEVLQTLFGLTPAEARLAYELARGSDLEQIAALKAVSMHTVRSQLKSVLQKTGMRRQSELVALVLRHTIDVAL